MKKIIILILLISIFISIFLFFPKNNITYSFYHWENTYNIKNSKDKLYIKVLDLEFSNKLEFIKTKFLEKVNKNFVPVVFITNNAMAKEPKDELINKISIYLKSLPQNFNEIQFDCDWTLSTKAKYFDFLKEIKKRLDKKLSATIRLHQIKYLKKTGVPPVDYGVLMYYNMSNIRDYKTKNSILDNNIARKYHYNFDIYPLRLKLALPLYSQAIQFRNKKAISIFEGLKKEDFLLINFRMIQENFYKANKSFYFKGRYIYKGDVFRFEDSDFNDLKEAKSDFFDLAKKPFNEVIFYSIKYKNKYDLNRL